MRFNLNKTVLASAVVGALGMGAVVAEAAVVDVASWDLTNFDADALRSDFAFFSVPSGSSTNQFGFSPETGCTNAPGGTNCVSIAMNGSAIAGNVFATGFNFGGTGDFKPNITAGGAAATLDTVGGAAGLTFSALNFGGTFPGLTGTQFFLSPNVLSNCTGQVGCGTSAAMGYNVETFTALGGTDYGVVVRYVGTINSPGSPFHGFQANWRLEGVMTTVVPVPAAVWLFGSGLLGLVGIARRKKKQTA